jgi:hypothetical protein
MDLDQQEIKNIYMKIKKTYKFFLFNNYIVNDNKKKQKNK